MPSSHAWIWTFIVVYTGMVTAFVGAIVIQAYRFYRNRRPSASER